MMILHSFVQWQHERSSWRTKASLFPEVSAFSTMTFMTWKCATESLIIIQTQNDHNVTDCFNLGQTFQLNPRFRGIVVWNWPLYHQNIDYRKCYLPCFLRQYRELRTLPSVKFRLWIWVLKVQPKIINQLLVLIHEVIICLVYTYTLAQPSYISNLDDCQIL